MGEDLKQIIIDLNKFLNKNLSLISFKALTSTDLLQVNIYHFLFFIICN